MTREQLNKVFDWLEENININDELEFKMNGGNNITAKFKGINKTFAEFYMKQIWNVINNDWSEEFIGSVNNE